MSSDEYDYRRAYPVIQLPESGRVPAGCTTEKLTVLQYDERVAGLEKLCNEIWSPRDLKQHPLSVEVRTAEIARAWRLWIQSHHSFLCVFSVLAYAYDRLLESAAPPAYAQARQWAEDVSALWKTAGALMVYGCDFYPTQAIYCTYIRTQMPAAFSGFWLREWILVRTAMRAWEEWLSNKQTPELLELQATVRQGLQVYHDHHDRVMQAAVPDGKSLAHDYHKLNGCKHPVAEHELATYDSWFRVERVPQTRWEFVDRTCREFSRTIGEIGHHSSLAQPVLDDIRFGFRAALRIFGSWLGPIPITSNYYPRTLRGE
jgi:hypothetical protein